MKVYNPTLDVTTCLRLYQGTQGVTPISYAGQPPTLLVLFRRKVYLCWEKGSWGLYCGRCKARGCWLGHLDTGCDLCTEYASNTGAPCRFLIVVY